MGLCRVLCGSTLPLSRNYTLTVDENDVILINLICFYFALPCMWPLGGLEQRADGTGHGRAQTSMAVSLSLFEFGFPEFVFFSLVFLSLFF